MMKTLHKIKATTAGLALLAASFAATSAMAQITHAGDVEIDGSLCVGLDCTGATVFGFDTQVLRENNLRILFDDTSTAASFPPNDWRLIANDSANGGSSHFTIEDATAGRNVFRVFAGARSNALVVDSQGDVGIGTATPATDIDIKIGDTPTVRLQQDGSSGFTPQTWDVAGNETNFFIRDVTHGSALPFRIRPDAPTNSIFVDTDGDVGLNTASPGAALHVRRTDGSAQLFVEETGATGSSTLFKLTSNARPIFEFDNTSVAAGAGQWRASSANNGDFEINNTGVTGAIPVEFDLASNGNLTLAGTVTAPSSRHFKTDINLVDGLKVLRELDAMPIVTWRYKNQSAENQHMGPIAEDFYEAFGLGEDEQFIALNDLSGVALAAVKALNEKVQERDEQIDTMADQIALLTKTVSGFQKVDDIGVEQ